MKLTILLSLLFFACENHDTKQEAIIETDVSSKNVQGATLAERFQPLPQFKRAEAAPGSFGNYLRHLPLHPDGKSVLLFNGSEKGNQNAHAAVVKMDLGEQDLQQCADAIMRLRAEYLYEQKQYDKLHFNFTNGFKAEFSRWKEGKGIAINGNSVSWKNESSNNASYSSFRKYLNKVFMFAGTASLEKELKPKNIKEIEIGDVFIRGGHPGHAVIVVDLCIDEKGGKAFMLAQSYMPAQEIQILKNPRNSKTSPWYKLSELSDVVETPEWDFSKDQLRSFQ